MLSIISFLSFNIKQYKKHKPEKDQCVAPNGRILPATSPDKKTTGKGGISKPRYKTCDYEPPCNDLYYLFASFQIILISTPVNMFKIINNVH
jgi:hypothetical protein